MAVAGLAGGLRWGIRCVCGRGGRNQLTVAWFRAQERADEARADRRRAVLQRQPPLISQKKRREARRG